MSTSRSRRLESLAMHLTGARQALERFANEVQQSSRKEHFTRLANHSKSAQDILSGVWDDDSLYRAFSYTMNAEYVGHEDVEETIDTHLDNLTKLITLTGVATVPKKIAKTHLHNLKKLIDLIDCVIGSGTGKGRTRGTRRPELKELDQLIVREAFRWWIEKRTRPGVSTDRNGRIHGPFVEQILKAAKKQSLQVNETQIGEAVYWLKRDKECKHLFSDGYKLPGETFAHFIGIDEGEKVGK